MGMYQPQEKVKEEELQEFWTDIFDIVWGKSMTVLALMTKYSFFL